jgi:creatinine amidohydrolase
MNSPRTSLPKSAAKSSAKAILIVARRTTGRSFQKSIEPCRYWANLSTRDFAELEAAQTIAVLPVAATEQHGPHLPLSVDTVIVESVIQAAIPQVAKGLSVLILPTQVIGKSNEHAAFRGTLSFSSETIMRVWTEIGDAVAAAGIKKLLLFNSHGGQVSVMDLVARDLREKHAMIVVSSSWYNLPVDMTAFSAHEMRFGIHAGEVETSILLAAAPHLVNMKFAEDFKSTSEERSKKYAILGNGRSAKFAWQTQDLNESGAVGNAKAATPVKGRRLIQEAGAKLAELLGEIHQLPLSLVNRKAR